MDLGLDPGGPKIYGTYGSGSGLGSATLFLMLEGDKGITCKLIITR